MAIHFRLKRADFFWYENEGTPASFTKGDKTRGLFIVINKNKLIMLNEEEEYYIFAPYNSEQLAAIKNQTLAAIICRNTRIKTLQPSVFLATSKG